MAPAAGVAWIRKGGGKGGHGFARRAKRANVSVGGEMGVKWAVRLRRSLGLAGAALDSLARPAMPAQCRAGHLLAEASAWEAARPAKSKRQVTNTEVFMVDRGVVGSREGAGRG